MLEQYAVDVLYHVRDVKGKHDLLIRGWTKSGAHAHSNTTIFTVFFQVDVASIWCVTFVFAVTDNQGHSIASQGSCHVDGTPC